MIDSIYQILRTARPRQWLKNVSLFAAPTFAGTLFTGTTLLSTIDAFLVFCLATSGIYFFNDLKDAPRDRLHPIKKNRAIASGKLSEKRAKVIIATLFATAIYTAFNVGTFFTYSVIVYLIVMVAYTTHFKNVIIVESLLVASGFIIRVFAGGFAAESSISSWLVLTTIGLSLLLAFGKRRSEKTLLLKHGGEDKKIATRKTLKHYPDTLLDSMISMSASFCIITYALFAFQASPTVVSKTLVNILPSIISTPKWMMVTIPLVIYGVARYLYVIYEKGEGESPARILLSDKPLLWSTISWGMLVYVVIYLMPLIS